MSDIKWPEKLDCNRHRSLTDAPKGSAHCLICAQIELWNACHDAFMRVIGTLKFFICDCKKQPCNLHQWNYVEAQPKLVALDVFEMARVIKTTKCREFSESEKNGIENFFVDIESFSKAEAICSKFGKPAVVPSVNSMYKIFMEDCFFGKGENVSNDAVVVFTQRGTLDEDEIKSRLEAIRKMIEDRIK